MTLRNWLNSLIPENAALGRGGVQVVSSPVFGRQNTAWAATSAAGTVSGPTIDLGARNGLAERIGVLAQMLPTAGQVAINNSIEIQWSDDGVVWYVCPTSAQGDARSSTTTITAADRTMISRGQCLARYMRWSITNPAAGLVAGNVFMWWTRI